jgi:hypothetical protein
MASSGVFSAFTYTDDEKAILASVLQTKTGVLTYL